MYTLHTPARHIVVSDTKFRLPSRPVAVTHTQCLEIHLFIHTLVTYKAIQGRGRDGDCKRNSRQEKPYFRISWIWEKEECVFNKIDIENRTANKMCFHNLFLLLT